MNFRRKPKINTKELDFDFIYTESSASEYSLKIINKNKAKNDWLRILLRQQKKKESIITKFKLKETKPNQICWQRRKSPDPKSVTL